MKIGIGIGIGNEKYKVEGRAKKWSMLRNADRSREINKSDTFKKDVI